MSAETILQHDRLRFGALVDLQTGAVLDHIQRATDRGLTFKLIPTVANPNKYRVELTGSLHRYGRGGLHNADDFTADDLRQTVEELVNTYGINANTSTLNNLEFGVNLQLPYPAADLLRALICYRGIPFERHTENGFSYYQATLQRYAVKIYNKGEQYGLGANLLRFEVKVLKMHHLHGRGILIKTLADLLNPNHYPPLGRLLAEVFGGVLFDEPLVTINDVPKRYRELLLQGRNPRYWERPEPTQPNYSQRRKQLQREEERFRKLLADHRPNRDRAPLGWQQETAALLVQKWEELIKTSNSLTGATSCDIAVIKCPKLTSQSERETLPEKVLKCPKLTDLTEEGETAEMSQINPLNVPLIWDNRPFGERGKPGGRGTVKYFVNSSDYRRPTATDLRANPALLEEVERGRKQYRKGSKEDRANRAAHHLRNDQSNPRNNLKRSINKPYRNGQQTLPFVDDSLSLTDYQRALLGRCGGD